MAYRWTLARQGRELFSFNIRLDEWALVSEATKKNGSLHSIFQEIVPSHADVVVDLTCGSMIHKIAVVLEACQRDELEFKSVYSIQIRMVDGYPWQTCSGFSGGRQGDNWVRMVTGVNLCKLIVYRIIDGSEAVVREIDARSLKSVDTDNFGTIRVRKRKGSRCDLLHDLTQVLNHVSQLGRDEILRIAIV